MYELILMCFVVARVYCDVLVKPGNILHWWAKVLERNLVIETFDPAFERKEHWLYKPLIGCCKCVTGQVALWSSLLSGNYNFFEIVFITCASILLTVVYEKRIN